MVCFTGAKCIYEEAGRGGELGGGNSERCLKWSGGGEGVNKESFQKTS